MNRDRLQQLAVLVENTFPLNETEDRPGAVLGPFELATHRLRTTTTRLYEGIPHRQTTERPLPETTRFWNGPYPRLTAHTKPARGRVLLTTAGLAIWHLAGTRPPGADQPWNYTSIDAFASTILGLDNWPDAARSLFAPTDWEVFGKDDARVSRHGPRPYRRATPSQAARAVRRLAETGEPQGPKEATELAKHLWSWT